MMIYEQLYVQRFSWDDLIHARWFTCNNLCATIYDLRATIYMRWFTCDDLCATIYDLCLTIYVRRFTIYVQWFTCKDLLIKSSSYVNHCKGIYPQSDLLTKRYSGKAIYRQSNNRQSNNRQTNYWQTNYWQSMEWG